MQYGFVFVLIHISENMLSALGRSRVQTILPTCIQVFRWSCLGESVTAILVRQYSIYFVFSLFPLPLKVYDTKSDPTQLFPSLLE